MTYDELTPEQKAKARECKTTDELVQLARDEGVDLTDEQLESVAGGFWEGCDLCDLGPVGSGH